MIRTDNMEGWEKRAKSVKKEICIRCNKENWPLWMVRTGDGHIDDDCYQKDFEIKYKELTGRTFPKNI